ncbi:uncharacterized protein LOC132167093 [Corylus avellana]|uniref:uncharacterized protein LOC132167093 n=1 Tax=Corylus avellana TaxID=13451 RepID=UPI00286A26BC|nr:uncharacterized protein LOC132167093 [Corylus avellana]
MARGILFPAGLTVLTIVVLVHQICSAEDCPPSTCGSIRNISYPFRLEGDPENCGDSRYALSCENNQTVLNLYDGKYYVRQINYNNYTIRVVDPGILTANDSFIARYPLGYDNFSSGDPYDVSHQNIPSSVVFLKCEKPVKSPWYFDISCLKNGVYSSDSSLSHSKKYTYFLFSSYTGVVEDLCQVAQVSLSPWPWSANDDLRNNISCTAVRNELLFGFQLFWYQVYCESRCGRNDYCYLNAENNVTCNGNGA